MQDDRLYDVLLRIAMAVEKLTVTTNTDNPPKRKRAVKTNDVIETPIVAEDTTTKQTEEPEKDTPTQPEYQRFVTKPNRFSNVLHSTAEESTTIESLVIEEAKTIGAATVSTIDAIQKTVMEPANVVTEDDDVTSFIESADCFEKLRNRTLVCYNRDMTRIFDALKAANVTTFNALRENKDNLRIFVTNLNAEERIQGIK